MKIYSFYIMAVTSSMLCYGVPSSSVPKVVKKLVPAVAAQAPSSVGMKGFVVPSRKSSSLTYEPKVNISVPINEVLASQGSTVKKGDKIFDLDCRGFDRELIDIQAQVEAKTLEVEKLGVEVEKEKTVGERRIQAAERAVLRSSEDYQDFTNKRKVAILRDEEMKLKRAQENLATREEELKQLKLIYGDDNISEDSEKIVHTRIVNDIAEAALILKNVKVSYELATTKGIARMDEDQKLSTENAQLQLDDTVKQCAFALKERQISLTSAKLTLTRLLERQTLLKEAYALLPLNAPESGMLLFGAYKGDFWVPTPTPKLVAGGKIETYDRLATIVPDDASWVVQALLADGMVSPEEGMPVTISFQSKEYPAKVTKSSRIPNNEGKRLLELTPINGAGLIPCSPVSISWKLEKKISPTANAKEPPASSGSGAEEVAKESNKPKK